MRDVLDKLDECDGRLRKFLIDSATAEIEANSPIKATPQEGSDDEVYLSRTRKETIRSEMLIDRIDDMKMKLGSKVTMRKTRKVKVDSKFR